MDVAEFFAGRDRSKRIFDEVLLAARALGPVDLRVTKSQIALVHGKPFAWVWIPEIYLRREGAPLVLTLSFRERRPWQRWKQIYEAAPRRFTHHLELWAPHEVDAEVRAWLQEAWDQEEVRPNA